MGRTVVSYAVFVSVVLAAGPGIGQGIEIAGTTPSKRPVDAPVITENIKDGNWYAQALRGVDRPYPYSLRFLEDQGDWFNPFLKPGMTGPYDLRGWH